MSETDVVVTGLGAVSACGIGRDHLWESVSQGRSGIGWIASFDIADWPVKFAGEVRDFDAIDRLNRHAGVRRERSLQMGLVAAAEALNQARLLDDEEYVSEELPVGVIVGSGLGPCFEAEFAYGCYFEKGRQAVRPTTVPKSMFNSLSSNLSIYFRLRGANHVIASACASGTSAIGHAFLAIKSGMEDIVLCGAADSPLAKV
jgi:3-oxoacyl-(acyl-carrier-protein) synthase